MPPGVDMIRANPGIMVHRFLLENLAFRLACLVGGDSFFGGPKESGVDRGEATLDPSCRWTE
jgi:hypothetical protein